MRDYFTLNQWYIEVRYKLETEPESMWKYLISSLVNFDTVLPQYDIR